MRVGLIAFLIVVALLAIALIGGGCTMYSSYKTAISLDEGVKKAWADIDAVLERRNNLIDNFVEVVKASAKHEKETLQQVIAARQQAVNASGPAEKAVASNLLSGALRNAIKIVNERYPDLKANQNFRDLTVQLEGSENRITEMRKRYNNAVRALNTHIRGPIGSIAAGWANVQRAEYFKAEESARETPKVDFDE